MKCCLPFKSILQNSSQKSSNTNFLPVWIHTDTWYFLENSEDMRASWKHLFVSSTALKTPHSFWKSVQAPESILCFLSKLSHPSNRRSTCPAIVLDQQQLKNHRGLNRFCAAHIAWALGSTQALLLCLCVSFQHWMKVWSQKYLSS